MISLSVTTCLLYTSNGCDIGEVILCGAALGACSVLSLFFGAAAGAACATASCGLAPVSYTHLNHKPLPIDPDIEEAIRKEFPDMPPDAGKIWSER